MELRAQVFSEEEVRSCANITATVQNLIVWHKALPAYREGDVVYIEFNTGHPDMLGKWEVSDTVLQGGVTNCVAGLKWIKIARKFQTKKCQNTVVHTST